MRLVVIVDGYTDEPAGLGVPPYIDIYPRYIAGAVWYADRTAKVLYFTIDSIRGDYFSFLKAASKADLVVFIAGVVVPGRYIGGRPATYEELARL
ncbi:MAG: radical SAM protein, partial [Thermofilum sp.]